MATGSCQGIMKSIATTEILPWIQLAGVVIGGKNGAGALHTRIRPFSVRHSYPCLSPLHRALILYLYLRSGA